MSTFKTLLIVYVVGGLTFVPLLIGLVLLFAYYTLPDVSQTSQRKARTDDPANLIRDNSSSEQLVFKTATGDLAEKFHRKHDSDVAAGYFAVFREDVPGGVNGKPPDKLSPAGEVVATESPSVYQSMYRSIFDRNQKPTIEPYKDSAIADGVKKVKRANNVFYVVLRHGHLMLYDDIQQLEVRYVISLEYHDVDIFSGIEGEQLAEAELWMKRNAIRLRRRQNAAGERNTSLPFFFFSENLSEKEDFYFALLKNQEKDRKDTPTVQEFEVNHIINLVQKLHSNEEQLETRWINALVGRIFLALYKTPFLEDVIRKKLTKKLSRVKKPNFITKLALQKISPGNSGPFITNPKLRDLSVNGDCVAEMDIEYNGHFRIEVAATARIDLGARFKAREVDMVLAATCKKLSGHLLVRLKPQPSNRLWIAFEKMPKIEMVLEPIVSTRQITYGVILKALEGRIMEVIAETLVLPFWDDMPFLATEGEAFRGGIWRKEPPSAQSTEIKDEDAEDEAEAGKEAERDVISAMKKDDRSLSMPVLSDSVNPAALQAAKKSVSSLKEVIGTHSPEKPSRAQAPRVLRSTSFASVADPTLSHTHADGATPTVDIRDAQKRDSVLLDLTRSLGSSPTGSNAGSMPNDSTLESVMRDRTTSDASKMSHEIPGRPSMERRSSAESRSTIGTNATRNSNISILGTEPDSPVSFDAPRGLGIRENHHKTLAETAKALANTDRKQAMNTINNAAAAAQKWGWGVLARNRQREAEAAAAREAVPPGPRSPMGRGQPFPPPGQPLPGPDRPSLFSIPKRKPVSQKLPTSTEAAPSESDSGRSSPKPPTLPDRPDRRRRQASLQASDEDKDDELLVVEAPVESNPTSPAREHDDDFFGHGEEPVEQRVAQHSDEVKPQLPIRRQDVEKASLDSVSGGAIKKAVREHEVNTGKIQDGRLQ